MLLYSTTDQSIRTHAVGFPLFPRFRSSMMGARQIELPPTRKRGYTAIYRTAHHFTVFTCPRSHPRACQTNPRRPGYLWICCSARSLPIENGDRGRRADDFHIKQAPEFQCTLVRRTTTVLCRLDARVVCVFVHNMPYSRYTRFT